MSDQHKYQVKLNWLEDRKGVIQSEVLDSKIEVVTPPEFPKGIEGKWSPEHLFVAAVNSCFMTTFLAVAENSKLDFSAMECNAVGTLDKVEGKYQITEKSRPSRKICTREILYEKRQRRYLYS